MSQAAYTKKVQVSTDGSNWEDVPATSPSLDFPSDALDTTDLATNQGYRSRILGLHDWTVSCDSNYKTGNSALTMIRNAKLNRSPLYVQYLPDGTTTNGYKGPVVVETFNMSGGVGDLETVSITLQGSGPLSDS